MLVFFGQGNFFNLVEVLVIPEYDNRSVLALQGTCLWAACASQGNIKELVYGRYVYEPG